MSMEKEKYVLYIASWWHRRSTLVVLDAQDSSSRINRQMLCCSTLHSLDRDNQWI